MKRTFVLFGCLVLLVACDEKSGDHGHDHDQKQDHQHEPTVKEGEAWTDNVPPIPENAKRIAVNVGDMGYEPNTMEAGPGEDVVLEVTRTSESECGRYIVVNGTDTRAELPLNEKIDIPVKMPDSGQVVFACGMDMMHGVLKVVSAAAPPGDAPAPKAAPADPPPPTGHEGHGHEGHDHGDGKAG